MISTDDSKRLRLRGDALDEDVERQDADPPIGPPTLLAKTTTLATYPTTAQCFFACLPLTLLGTEAEGAPGAISAGDSPFFALNLGGSIPPSGTQIVTTFVGNRWVFRYDA